ncbi:sugar-binding transcriptional regulator [Kocuria sp. TGY1127_2]|uniref:sugar-binding transcriptional regulator n=1 Tax=Kocuria sp. TGY1127_2 TaxID=2711328 RepID=UPI0015C1B2EA|nr:sugar-binding domain-containing protein [Kocuria sp. TGY1127_2]
MTLSQTGDNWDPYLHDKRAKALEVASRYYAQGQTMQAIARALGMSRSTVSRLLSWAKEVGLIEVRVRPGRSNDLVIENRLKDEYGLESCTVVPTGSSDVGESLEAVALRGAHLVHELLESDMVMAISWGTMIDSVSRCLTPKSTVNCQVVQLNGFGNSITSGIHYSNLIMERFGTAFNAYVQQFPVPLFFDSPVTRDALFSERSIARIRRLQQTADLVLFNVGTLDDNLPNGPYLAGYYVGTDDSRELESEQCVGEISATYFRKDGSSHDIEFNRRTSGPDLEGLRSSRYRVCVTCGARKVTALYGALNGGLITHLVTDVTTAQQLIDQAKPSAR